MKAESMTVSIKLFAASAVLITSIGLSGCSAFAKTPINCEGNTAENNSEIKNDVVALIAPTSNFTLFENALSGSEQAISEKLGWKGSRLSTVLVDGDPELKTSALMEPSSNQGDGEIRAKQQSGQPRTVYYCLTQNESFEYEGTITASDGADFVQAFTVAARSFDSTATDSNKVIVVVGNGLQTTGQVNFAENGIPQISSISGMITQLKEQGALPDLQGATVDWIGLGVTDGSTQEKLNQQSLDALTAFWTAFILASNGHVGTIQGEITAGTPDPKSIKTPTISALPDACVEATLTSEQGFNFQPNLPVFIDEAQARVGAEAIAKELKAKKGCTGTITVTGYTASGVDQGEYVYGSNYILSLQRAEAFKQLLVDAGVTVPIEAVGGDKGPYIDWDASGKFSEDLGKQNRMVVISQQ